MNIKQYLNTQNTQYTDNGSSSDTAHETSMQQPLQREQGLLKIKSDLDEWISMMPRCTTMISTQESLNFRNNGTHGESL